jgi:hypothetical protein
MNHTISRDKLEERLRAEAGSEPPVSGMLHARIMAGVRMAEPLPARRGVHPEWVAMLAVLVLAAGFLAMLRPGDSARPDPGRAAFAGPMPSIQAVLALIPGVYPQPDAPLNREADALKNDLASVGSYLLACTGIDG